MLRRLLAVCLLLLTLSACSQPVAPPASRVAAPEQALTTIKLAAIKNLSDPEFDSLIAGFQAENPAYRVEKVLFDWGPDGDSQLREAVNSGQIDVLQDISVDYALRPVTFRALDGFLAQGELDQAGFGDLLNQMRTDGRLLMMPYAAYPFLLVYNTEMARAAGVTIPADRWTWAEFRLALSKLTQGQGEAKIWGLDSQIQTDFAHMYLEQKYRVPIWQAKYDELHDALSFFHTLIFADQSMRPMPRRDRNSREPIELWSLKPLNEKRAAMTYEAPVPLPRIRRELKVPWDVAPMPSLPGTKPILHIMPRTVGIANQSNQAEAAWKFISFIAGPKGAEISARSGEIPAYLTEPVLKAFAEQGYPPGLASIWNASWRIHIPPQSPREFGSHHGTADRAVHESLSGEKPLEEALGPLKNLP